MATSSARTTRERAMCSYCGHARREHRGSSCQSGACDCPRFLSRDVCAVETEKLGNLVLAFIGRWNTERPPISKAGGRGGGARLSETMGALEWLSQETGIEMLSLKTLTLRNRRTGRLGKTTTTDLRVADTIVNAIDHPFAYHDGTLEIIPNPIFRNEATRSLAASCCGGSRG